MVEALGIIATIFVLLSFLFRAEKKIRIVNIIGAALFVAYGILMGALSVWLLNTLLIIIHIYFLLRK